MIRDGGNNRFRAAALKQDVHAFAAGQLTDFIRQCLLVFAVYCVQTLIFLSHLQFFIKHITDDDI